MDIKSLTCCFSCLFSILIIAIMCNPTASSNSETKKKYIIFDTDMGSDDAWALQMILKAEKEQQNVKVLAITAVSGNTSPENVAKNSYRILDGVGRTDIPIYKGAIEAFIPSDLQSAQFYGVNGFSDVEFWKPSYPHDVNEIFQQKSAVEIIRELVMTNPHEISIISIGPLTNVALAIKAYPEIKENIKEIYIMGGNYQGKGNALRGSEYNFFKDPEAAYILLNSLNCPITILPIESPESVNITLEWRFNVLGKVDNENVQLLNKVEQIAFRNSERFEPFDALLVASFLFPECIRQQNRYNATIELQGIHTRGQMVFDRSSSDYNVNVVEMVHEDKFKEILLWAAKP
ncbi:uncharacterized protein C1683.06c-like [Contarinia nasturtii]|uniref:uncharacterized protein C1683.06c-like n=1 Tax=Contarinia nasturtii TaxID=265458 RepID=UPI0012D3C392|nr:uncharacterized protein C1683.06c-like [Contarinia nasturtii]